MTGRCLAVTVWQKCRRNTFGQTPVAGRATGYGGGSRHPVSVLT